jgi:hypothetical protein
LHNREHKINSNYKKAENVLEIILNQEELQNFQSCLFRTISSNFEDEDKVLFAMIDQLEMKDLSEKKYIRLYTNKSNNTELNTVDCENVKSFQSYKIILKEIVEYLNELNSAGENFSNLRQVKSKEKQAEFINVHLS